MQLRGKENNKRSKGAQGGSKKLKEGIVASFFGMRSREGVRVAGEFVRPWGGAILYHAFQ